MPDLPAYRRARSPTAKAERRAVLLDAARERLAGAELADVSVAQIARTAGLAKGTVYVYFRTREELFIGLLEDELDGWFGELDRALATGAGRITAAALTDFLVPSLTNRPLLRRLLAVLGSVLEQNLDPDPALRFKWRLAGRMTATGSLLEKRCVFLRPGDGVRVLQQLQALAVGLQVQAEPAPAVRGLLGAPGLEPLRVEFDREFRAATRALLTGLERTN